MQQNTWSIVKFINEDMVEAVPTIWLLGNSCYWPPYTREKLMKSIRRLEPPNTCWPQHSIEIFRNGTYDDYATARSKCKLAENFSDLNSEVEELKNGKIRKIRRKKPIVSSTDDESYGETDTGGLPPPPELNNVDGSQTYGTLQFQETDLSSPSPCFLTKENEKITETGTKETKCCSCCGKNGESLKNIYRHQILLKNICGDILEQIKSLNLKGPPDVGEASIFVTFPFFPVDSDEVMEDLNTFLGNTENFNLAVKELSKVGGNNSYDFVKRCMNMLITNHYGNQYSWLGAKKKKKLCDQKMAEVLLGSPLFSGSIEKIISKAHKETELYLKNNIDGLVLENMHDVPYIQSKHFGPEVTATMTRICSELRTIIPKTTPFGIQVLSGGNKEALAIAKACSMNFIRAEGFVFSHIADEGFTDANAGLILRYRKQIEAEDVLVFTDIKKKHSSHAITGDITLTETAKAAEFFLSDGVILTGTATGDPADTKELQELKNSTSLPVLVGSGVTYDNLEDYTSADALIVGSHFKKEGQWYNELDENRIKKFMNKISMIKNL